MGKNVAVGGILLMILIWNLSIPAPVRKGKVLPVVVVVVAAAVNVEAVNVVVVAVVVAGHGGGSVPTPGSWPSP